MPGRSPSDLFTPCLVKSSWLQWSGLQPAVRLIAYRLPPGLRDTCSHPLMTGKLGDELDAKAQAATDALQPAHAYVPWMVVNDVPLGASYEALKSVVCAAYAGER